MKEGYANQKYLSPITPLFPLRSSRHRNEAAVGHVPCHSIKSLWHWSMAITIDFEAARLDHQSDPH